MKSLFVGNMSFQTSEGELRELFAPFGQVTRVHMAMDRETGRARGFAGLARVHAEGDAGNACRELPQRGAAREASWRACGTGRHARYGSARRRRRAGAGPDESGRACAATSGRRAREDFRSAACGRTCTCVFASASAGARRRVSRCALANRTQRFRKGSQPPGPSGFARPAESTRRICLPRSISPMAVMS